MTLSAVLLAGGESRRMGKDKTQVIFEGEPLWERQIRLLQQLKPKEIFISARREPPWRPSGIEVLLDEFPSRGPMSGIFAALSRLQTSHLLALAVDMPFIVESDLRYLVSLSQKDRGIVTAIDGRAEPLVAIYSKPLWKEFATALASDDHSLQTLVSHLADAGMIEIVELAKNDEAHYRSLNTPEDLATS